MNYLFTSDYHLGHENIIKYCNRPFKSIEEMNRIIIRKHNERVKKEDVVFFIGDFCFKNTKGGKSGEGLLTKAKTYENKLNGKIIFIKGNHDKNNSCKTIIERIGIRFGGNRINLVHDPRFADVNYDINFCGHVHDHWKFKRIKFGYSYTDIVNVGVDVWGFKPIYYNEIMHEYNKWLKQNKLEHTKVSF